MTNVENNRIRRIKLKEIGLCYHCMQPKDRPDRGLCADCRKRYTENTKTNKAKLKDEVYAAYGGYKCNCCGLTNRVFLQLDHINDNGADHRRELKGEGTGGGSQIYYWLKRNGFPSTMQVLCVNCHLAKTAKVPCPCKKNKPTYDYEDGGVDSD